MRETRAITLQEPGQWLWRRDLESVRSILRTGAARSTPRRQSSRRCDANYLRISGLRGATPWRAGFYRAPGISVLEGHVEFGANSGQRPERGLWRVWNIQTVRRGSLHEETSELRAPARIRPFAAFGTKRAIRVTGCPEGTRSDANPDSGAAARSPTLAIPSRTARLGSARHEAHRQCADGQSRQ